MVSILDLQTGKALLDVARGVDFEAGRIWSQPGEDITGKVAQTGRPLAFANLGDETLFLDRTGARKTLNRDELAFLCVPIFYQERLVGVLSADKLAHQVDDLDREVEILVAVAELLGKVVHFRVVEEENRRLRRMLAEFQDYSGCAAPDRSGRRYQHDGADPSPVVSTITTLLG